MIIIILVTRLLINLLKSDFSSSLELSNLNEDKNENIKNDSNINLLNNLFDDLLDKYNKNEEKRENFKQKEEIDYFNNIINNIESLLTDENFDTTNLDEGEESILNLEKLIITLTTTQKEKNKEIETNNNITKLDIGQCEKELRDHYNLTDDELLYMEKMEIPQPEKKITKIEYNIYCKLFGSKLVRLNISECKNSKILLSIPMQLSGNLDKLNSSSGYFNDLYYTSTSDSGTDITLGDRRYQYVEGSQIVCQENCFFANYNSTIQYADCFCNAKESSSDFGNMNINKEGLYF